MRRPVKVSGRWNATRNRSTGPLNGSKTQPAKVASLPEGVKRKVRYASESRVPIGSEDSPAREHPPAPPAGGSRSRRTCRGAIGDGLHLPFPKAIRPKCGTRDPHARMPFRFSDRTGTGVLAEIASRNVDGCLDPAKCEQEFRPGRFEEKHLERRLLPAQSEHTVDARVDPRSKLPPALARFGHRLRTWSTIPRNSMDLFFLPPVHVAALSWKLSG